MARNCSNLRLWWYRRLNQPFWTSVWVALGLLILGVAAGMLASTQNEQASLTIAAQTESITAENVCPIASVDFILPPGRLEQLSFDETPEPIEIEEPMLLRIQGQYKINVRRRFGEPVTLTISASSDAEASGEPWSMMLLGSQTAARGRALTPFQATYTARDAGDASRPIAWPLVGRIVVGEAVSTNYGDVSESVPRQPHLLLDGTIRIRTAAWIDSSRIDLGEHKLEMGDIVDTDRPPNGAAAADDEKACAVRQASGLVRLGSTDALQVVVHTDQDAVRVIRGRVVHIGASAIESITQQPLVRLAWQGALIVFLLIGVLQQLFEMLSFYRNGDSDERVPDAPRPSNGNDNEQPPSQSRDG